MTDKDCYKKLYGDLIYHVSHYYPNRRLTPYELYMCFALQNSYNLPRKER